jgi:hypothetical protein
MIRIQHLAQQMAPWPSGSKQPPAEQDEIFCFCVEKNLHGQGGTTSLCHSSGQGHYTCTLHFLHDTPTACYKLKKEREIGN